MHDHDEDRPVRAEWLDRPAIAITTLSRKLTNRYVGTCDHLDAWQDIGEAAILSQSSLDGVPEDICEPVLTTLLVQVHPEEGIDPGGDEVGAALRDSHTRAGCHHEYDCCGCRSYHARPTHLKDGFWMVEIQSSRNF